MMMNKNNHSISKRQGIWAAFLLAFAFTIAQPAKAQAQWVTNGNNVNNTNTGNVGIGTTNPITSLHVVGPILSSGPLASQVFQDRTSGRLWMWYSIGDTARLWNGNNDIFGITPVGNFGIGTTGPGFKLDVQGGQINASGGLCIAGDCRTSWSQVGGSGSGSSQWTTSGASIFYNSGNVGIGTTNPTALLHLHVSSGEVIQRFTNASVGGTLDLRYKFESSQHRMGVTDAFGNWQFYTQFGSPNTSSIGYFPGSVGIGTTTPASKLEVIGNIALSPDKHITSTADWGNYIKPYESGTGRMAFGTAGIDRINILYNGNVGIGITNPAYRLDVQGGQINTSGGLCIAGDCKTSWSQLGGSSQWTTSGANISYNSGNVGIGTTTPTSKLHVAGNGKVTGNLTVIGDLIVDGNIAAKYQDMAEWVPASEQIPAGTVVVLDSTKSNQVISSSQAYDTRVAGVISEKPGIALGESGNNKVLVATTGRVRIKVDATRGAIHIGDLLVTSDISGVAMKSEPVNISGVQIHRPGTLIGKALEPLDRGAGEILVLLSLQ